MKKTIVAVGLMTVSVMFGGCHQKELESRQLRIDSLQRIVDTKDMEIDSLFTMLNEIEDNLSMINSKYSTVQEMRRRTTEGDFNQKKEIAAQLSAIESMMADNKQKIAKLNERVNNLTGKNTDLEGYITRLEERAAQQEQQIASLMAELQSSKEIIEGLNRNVSELTATNQEKDERIALQIAEANKAWFVVGGYDELKESGIVSKSGGFLGIGRKQGTVADMNTDLFTEIDRTKVTTISINKKKAVVVSQHPAGRYELVADEEDASVTAYLRIRCSSGNTPTIWWSPPSSRAE